MSLWPSLGYTRPKAWAMSASDCPEPGVPAPA